MSLLLIIYGLAAFLKTPGLSSSQARYIGYAWPVFWLAVPALAHNNTAMQLAGGVIAEASGMPLEKCVASRLFKPLGTAFS